MMKKDVGATTVSGGCQQPRVLQTRMVRAFKNYVVARAAWAHLVVPALFAVPRLVVFYPLARGKLDRFLGGASSCVYVCFRF